MEPMTLGSPSGSPATGGGSNYLPSFLMGVDHNVSSSGTRGNTFSPKGRNNYSFASPTSGTSPDYNKSSLGQKTLFGYQQTSPSSSAAVNNSEIMHQNRFSPKGRNNYSFASPTSGTSPDYNKSSLGQKTLFGYQQTPPSSSAAVNNSEIMHQNPNQSITGPPIKGLFDSLRTERNQIQSPSTQNTSQFGAAGINSSYYNQSINEGNLTNASFNASHMLSYNADERNDFANSNFRHYGATPSNFTNFWITVFGFPPSATSTILAHFSQCGIILDKVFPPQNGNWVHLKFSSRLECDKALNCNEKILGGNIMIGVTHCKDAKLIESSAQSKSAICSLSQVSYKCAQKESAVIASPQTPQRSSGLVNKAMDLLFGW